MDKHDVNIFRLGIDSILNPNYSWHGHIDNFFEIVKTTGYPYFSWNGEVYKVNDYQEGYTKLKVTYDEIREKDLINP